MITRERLEELVGTHSMLYYISNDRVMEYEWLDTFYIKEAYDSAEKIYYDAICCSCGKCKERFGKDWEWNLVNNITRTMYEKKADAEFILKYHTKKSVKFEPLTWDEISDDNEHEIIQDFTIDNLNCKCRVLIYKDNFITTIVGWTGYGLEQKTYEYSKDGYLKAIEYSKNLFLGNTNHLEGLL